VAQPYIGEIRIFAGNFAPAGWMDCDGQLLAISENDVLFQLIGTTYGGDGQTTFALPNLQSRVPVHMGTGADGITYQLAETGGVETVTLTTQQMPVHTHVLSGSSNQANANTTSGNLLATIPLSAGQFAYGTVAPILPLDVSSIGPDGGSQPHENMQPYNVLRYIISLFGIFPSQQN
jgi:microcystin-dependent protein